ncbi:uncharacterized protein LOC114526636 [Dendronephthya gigantea]|uniref:uncharacterized protein LOC114526636 n=1 Tax=Dendronephthya gigantea TaxID=151771 RepID=UPI00106BFAFF|nr:uncharacterized protein LOC114526636 [Dendronephthya gigantea]
MTETQPSEDLVKQLKTKADLLRLTNEETREIITKAKTNELERQRKTLNDKLQEVHDLKLRIQEIKLGEGITPDEVRAWTEGIKSNDIIPIENAISELETVIETTKKNELRKKENLAAQGRDEQYQEKLKYDKEKLELQLVYEKKITEERTKRSSKNESRKPNVRLQKLQITKFDGTYADWLRFWNQFEAEIQAAEIPAVTKFNYLKELVTPKVRIAIQGLPCTTEGYERARNILQTRYGKSSEIVNSYVQNIMSLPNIHGCQPSKIHEFYEKLMCNVQSLETLGKLNEVNGYVRATIDKLEGIRGDLVRMDDDWQEWKFPELVKALEKWTVRNPIKPSNEKHAMKPPQFPLKRERNFNTRQEDREVRNPRACVYCDGADHRSVDCKKVELTVDRKKLLSSKQLCFNCARPNHKASECKSRTVCQKCNRRHHTSICDNRDNDGIDNSSALLTASSTGNAMVTYPVVIVDVNGVKCRALLDTGAGSSYASSALIDLIKAKPTRKEFKHIEMMLGSVNKVISVYNMSINNLEGDFQLHIEVTKVDRKELLTLKNPNYQETLAKFPHLSDVQMHDNDKKPELPVHLILGASEYARIKTETKPKIGRPNEPVAELTKFGWTILTPGKEINLTPMLMTQTACPDYEQLCRLDVLGLEDSATGDQSMVYEEFKEQLARNPEGWYETGLPWKGNHPSLPNNMAGSLSRLDNLIRKLEKQDSLEQYKIIQDQLEQGIVERVDNDAKGKEFYIPHKPVIRESAETTKMRVVYDASARANPKVPSLNDCLETGPPLQNLLWNVLVRNRFHPIAVTGDLKQAFLQVRIRENDRDVLRFHWLKDLQTKEKEVLRFTRALFGLAPSPFLLAGVIKEHLRGLKPKYPDLVEEMERSLYVDDLIGGADSKPKALELKQAAKEVFGEAGFQLHKWHSNAKEVEYEDTTANDDNQTYAKQQLGVKQGETKLLGLAWDKDQDNIQVNIPNDTANCTKRGILGKMARIYDPLGLISPLTLTGKTLYRDACDLRIAWDAPLPSTLQQRWWKYEQVLPSQVTVPRSLAKSEEPIESIELHAFGDASGIGVSAAVYAIVRQPSSVSSGLVTAKSRLAKKGLTIPRLELVSGHMATNLVHNVKQSLEGFPVQRVLGWLDSTVALHWIRGNGEFKQFVGNRVRKIQERSYIEWRHVTSADNPADLGSRGGNVKQSGSLWWKGPAGCSIKRNGPPTSLPGIPVRHKPKQKR